MNSAFIDCRKEITNQPDKWEQPIDFEVLYMTIK